VIVNSVLPGCPRTGRLSREEAASDRHPGLDGGEDLRPAARCQSSIVRGHQWVLSHGHGQV